MISKLKVWNISSIFFLTIIVLNIIQYMWIIPYNYAFPVKILITILMVFEIVRRQFRFSSKFILYMFIFIGMFSLNLLVFDLFYNFLYLIDFIILYLYIYSVYHHLENFIIEYFKITYILIILTSFISVVFGRSVLGGRFEGFFSNPNTLGLFIALFYPFILFSKSSSTYSKIFFGISGFMLTLFTGSRNSLFAFLLVTFLFTFYKLKPYFANKPFHVNIKTIFFTLCMVAIIYASFRFLPISKNVAQRFDYSFSSTEHLLSSRAPNFEEAFEQFKSSPLLGIGYSPQSVKIGTTAASTYLDFLSFYGIIGTVIFLFPIFMIFSKVKKISFRNFILVLDVLSLAIAESYMETPLGIGAFFAWFIIISLAFS